MIRKFDTIAYGEISYKITIAQGAAALIFGASIQAIPLLDPEEKLAYFKIYATLCAVLTAIGALIIGPTAFVFSLYGLINLLTGWGIATNKQLKTAIIRAIAFAPPTLYLALESQNSNFENIFFITFGISNLLLLTCLPLKEMLACKGKFNKKMSYGYQLHSIIFQSSKLAERNVFLSILSPLQFGYYSMFRDITNGVNFTLFSSWYQLRFVKISDEIAQKSINLARYATKAIAALILITLSAHLAGPALRTIAVNILNKPLEVSTITILCIIAQLDFFKAMNLTWIEGTKKIRKLILVDVADIILVLSLGLMPLFYDFLDINDTAIALLLRIAIAVIITLLAIGAL